ncbi:MULTISPECIES: hypothetical protein [unclassified Shinella]|nr:MULTISPECIES: hypothetical protein [unclassified Shinella]MCA0339176.1 hypothetical protein [Pseudomonadota bacterium]MCO5148540.1 hypothetical protein [Shinella sp.]MDG4673684.1 hypothetical protein [Shinella sp. 838]
MNDPGYPRLRICADANWRAIVRAAACELDRRIRHGPAFRFARKRF